MMETLTLDVELIEGASCDMFFCDCKKSRYVLQWESKNLIAVSTAIQDWLTSSK